MLGLYAGRFQPFHLGHYYAIQHIKSKVDKVFVLICSKRDINPLDDKNPFTFEERQEMILQSFPDICVFHIEDQENDTLWTKVIESYIPHDDKVSFSNNPNTIKAFEDHGYVTSEIPVKAQGLNATLVRKLIIRREPWEHLVPSSTVDVVRGVWMKNV